MKLPSSLDVGLIESTGPYHISCYISNRGSSIQLKNNLKSALKDLKQLLDGSLSCRQQQRYTKPLRALILSSRARSEIKESIAIFISEAKVSILRLPFSVENTVIVSESFYLKPLLAQYQFKRERLLLGLEEDGISLYDVKLNQTHFLEKIIPPAGYKNYRNSEKFSVTIDYTVDYILKNFDCEKYEFIITGDRNFRERFKFKARGLKVEELEHFERFEEKYISAIESQISIYLEEQKKLYLQAFFRRYNEAISKGQIEENLLKIARETIEDNLEVLFIACDFQIYGYLNKTNGNLYTNPNQLNAKDNEILNELSQIAIKNKVDVIFLPRNQMPGEQLCTAILKSPIKQTLPKSELLQSVWS